MKSSKRRSFGPQRFVVTKDGEGIANHVGSLALRDLADGLGFDAGFVGGDGAAAATAADPRPWRDSARRHRDC